MISIIIPVYNAEKKPSIDVLVLYALKLIKIGNLYWWTMAVKIIRGKYAMNTANKIKCIHVIHKENEGVSKARNAGLKIATGVIFSLLILTTGLTITTCRTSYAIHSSYDIVISAFQIEDPKHHIAYSFNESFKAR